MTLLDDRPAPPIDERNIDTGPKRTPTASWRLATRLARREVRRRPGRTLLVALLVAIPTLAMTIGSIVVRSDTSQAAYTRSYGASDFAVEQYSYVDETGLQQGPVTADDLPDGTLPTGTTSTDVLTTDTLVTTAAEDRIDVAATHLDATSPIVDGIVDVTDGRLPVDGTDELLLHPALADELDVGVGDGLVLARPDRTLTVVGLGRANADHGRPLMLFGRLDPDELRSGSVTTLVDLPPGASTDAALGAIAASGALSMDQIQGFSARTPDGYWYANNGSWTGDDADGQTLAWGWVAGALSLAALGVIIAAAFATSARRQLATVGQLAANGASPKLIRRTLSLQGTWSGAVGAAIGIGIGITLFLAGTPVIERILNRSWSTTTIDPADMIVLFVTGVTAATIAALLPARSLATTSVLSALAGRRPIRPVRPRTVTAGVICFGAGLFLLAVATTAATTAPGDGPSSNDDLFALVAVIGGVGVLAGMCLASPLAITVSTAVAARLGPSWRLSGRSLYRTRWRSAAVVTAIGVAGAFAVAGASVASNIDEGAGGPTDLPRNVVLLRTDDGTAVSTIEPALLDGVRDVVGPSAESLVYGLDLVPPSDAQLESAYPGESEPGFDPNESFFVAAPFDVVVADESLVDGMGLSNRDRAALEEYGVLTLWANYVYVGDGAFTAPSSSKVRVVSASGVHEFEAAAIQDPYGSRNGTSGLLISRERAGELGIGVVATGIRFTADDDLTGEQRRSLDGIRFGSDAFTDAWIVGDEPATYPDGGGRGFWIDYQWVNWTPSQTLVQAAIVGATLLFVLLVVAIGLSLAAVESRDERNTLIAVGASPSTLRRRSATTATVLTVTGGVLAVPTGLLPVWVVSHVSDQRTDVPWLSIVAIVAVVPLLVGTLAFVGSAGIQRLRPPKVMQNFTD